MNDPALLERVLRSAPHFASLSPDERGALAATLRPRRIEPGQAIFRQGQPGDALVLLASGRLVVRRDTGGGKEVDLQQIGPGEVVGEMSCLDPAPRSATVLALAPSLVYELDRTTIQAIRTNAPGLAVALVDGVVRQLTRRLRETTARIRSSEAVSADLDDVGSAPDVRPTRADAFMGATPYTGEIDLGRIPTLRGLAPAEREVLARVAPPMAFADGAYLCREGELGRTCFILAAGETEVLADLPEGEALLAVLGPGAFVGQLALVDDAPRSASVRAKAGAVALVIIRETFRRLLGAREPLAMKLQDQVAVAGIRQLRRANEHIRGVLAERSAPRPTPGPPPEPARARRTRESSESNPVLSTPEPARARRTPSAPRPPSPGPAAPTRSQPAGQRIYVEAALREWGLSLTDLDQVRVKKVDGVISATELKARRRW